MGAVKIPQQTVNNMKYEGFNKPSPTLTKPNTSGLNVGDVLEKVSGVASFVPKWSGYGLALYLGTESAIGIYDKFFDKGVQKIAESIPQQELDVHSTLPNYKENIDKTKEIEPPSVSVNSEDTLIGILKSKTNSNQEAEYSRQMMEAMTYNNVMLVNSIDRLSGIVGLSAEKSSVTQESILANNIQLVDVLGTVANGIGDAEVNLAYKDNGYSNSIDILNTLQEIKQSLSETLPNAVSDFKPVEIKEQKISFPDEHTININRSIDEVSLTSKKLKNMDNEIPLTEKKLQHINYELEPIQLDNMGEEIPKATPQELRAIKDAVVAKKHSDENTFEVDEDDIDDIFDTPIDISEIFTFLKKSDRYGEITK